MDSRSPSLQRNSQSSVANSPSNWRASYSLCSVSAHAGEDRMEFYQIKFLLKWIIVEKCIVLCHGTIWCYVWMFFLEGLILGLPY